MKPFDDKLSDHIRERFDNYHEPVDHQAWQRLQARLDKKSRPARVVVFRHLARAAAVLLLFASAFFFYHLVVLTGDPDMVVSVDVSPIQSQEGILHIVREPVPDLSPRTYTEYTEVVGTAWTPPGEEREEMLSEDPPELSAPGIAMTAMYQKPIAPETTPRPSVQRAYQEPGTADERFGASPVLVPAEEHTYRPGTSIRWSFVAGSHMTHAENQVAEGVGFGAGVLAEYPLTSLLSVSSGVVLARHHFSVEDMPVAAYNQQSDFEGLAFVRFEVFGDHTYRHYTADIPLNIKLRVWDRPGHSLSALAGVSSLLFFRQSVEGVSRVYATGYLDEDGTHIAHSTTQVGRHEFSAGQPTVRDRFDPAGMLHFSVAYESETSGHAWGIEPFVKLPLGPVSGHQLRFATGGINIRYRLFN